MRKDRKTVVGKNLLENVDAAAIRRRYNDVHYDVPRKDFATTFFTTCGKSCDTTSLVVHLGQKS